jgi:hypothetical protein
MRKILCTTIALLTVLAPKHCTSEVAAQVLPLELSQLLESLLACERPQGGWMYVCPGGRQVRGVTRIMKTAHKVARALGVEPWDLVVLRSPGTPAAGLLFVHAYQATGHENYLAAARRTADLLVNLQLPSGGWFSEMPVYGNRLARWFSIAPWATLDDDVTPGAVRCLLHVWQETGDVRYRKAAARGLDLLLEAQLSSGAWPLTWRPGWLRFLSPSFEDGPSLNDAATTAAIHALVEGARILRQPSLRSAAAQAGDWLRHAQTRTSRGGWAQQYDRSGQPVPGRRFEPAALASWESRHALEALHALAAATGDGRFCAPFPQAVAWLRNAALAPGCWARFYDLATNEPLYLDAQGKRVPSPQQAKRPYRWQGDFGIPALFFTLGLDVAGHPLTGQYSGAAPLWRLPGDAGECPQARSPQGDAIVANPRALIAAAASHMARLISQPASPCAPTVQARLSADRGLGRSRSVSSSRLP